MADPTGVAASPAGIAPPAGDVCPLLALDLAGEVGPSAAAATRTPAAIVGGRCTATSPAASISGAQRRLVCAVVDHLDCPRYVRATKGGRGPVAGRAGRVPAVVVAAATTGSVRPTAAADAGPDRPSTKTDEVSVSGPELAASGSSGDPIAAAAAVVAVAPATEPAQVRVPAPTAPPTATPTPTPAATPVRPVTRSSGRSGARPARSRPLPIVIAGAILVICLVIAFVFTSIRGGLALPGATSGSEGSAGVALTTPGPTAFGTTGASAPAGTPSPTPAPTPTPTEVSTPSAAASATPGSTPAASLPAAYAGLKPCPDRARCYLYRIRSGDSLTKVADRFGVTLAAIKAINPKITSPSLIHVGDVIRVPLPRG